MVAQKSISYPKVTIPDIFKAFWSGIRPQKWWFFFLIFCLVIGNIFPVIVPVYYKQFFDVITTGTDKSSLVPQLFTIIALIFALNFLYWLFYRLAEMANFMYQANAVARLKQNAYNYLIEHSYSFFTNNFVGSLVQRVNRFARAYERLSDHLTWDILPLLVKIISIFLIVFFVNSTIALVILGWAAIFIVFNITFSNWKLKYDLRVADIDSKTTGYLADTLTNQNTISLFSAFKRESDGYREITSKQAKLTRFTWSLDTVINGVQFFLTIAIEFILFYFAIQYWQQGLLTVGVFVLLQAYLITLLGQLWSITRTVRDIYQGYADAREMVEIMLLPHDIKDVPTAKGLKASDGKIDFTDLTFSFHETRKVLDKVDLTIEPGQKVALIGPSGAGKTTFVRLLLRLYSPTAGTISIDGQDIAKITQESLRKNISLVPQDTVLFHRTLADNICYGKPGASIKDIEKAAKMAHCDEFIKNLPQGLKTYVGERGIKLSGGERQRVAIARAMLKNAPILVLDEATSSLDSHSEVLIQDALDTLMKGKTTIVIAHRLSTIRKMDRIIVVDGGKIIEDGNHKELLGKRGSMYKKLWTLQAGGFITDETENGLDEKREEASPQTSES